MHIVSVELLYSLPHLGDVCLSIGREVSVDIQIDLRQQCDCNRWQDLALPEAISAPGVTTAMLVARFGQCHGAAASPGALSAAGDP